MTAPAAAKLSAAIIHGLEQQLHLYRRLVTLAEAKQEALIATDIDQLNLLVREMEGLAHIAAGLEEDRRAQVARLTGSADTRLTDLAQHFESPERDRLESVRITLRDTMTCLRDLNAINAGLVRQAQIVAEGHMRLFRAAMPATYGATGTTVQPKSMRREWKG
jgi:flagellar biosynthesis/type III secretory pathway chaperone